MLKAHSKDFAYSVNRGKGQFSICRRFTMIYLYNPTIYNYIYIIIIYYLVILRYTENIWQQGFPIARFDDRSSAQAARPEIPQLRINLLCPNSLGCSDKSDNGWKWRKLGEIGYPWLVHSFRCSIPFFLIIFPRNIAILGVSLPGSRLLPQLSVDEVTFQSRKVMMINHRNCWHVPCETNPFGRTCPQPNKYCQRAGSGALRIAGLAMLAFRILGEKEELDKQTHKHRVSRVLMIPTAVRHWRSVAPIC